SVWRMLARNWLPRPSPLEAPATRPAMSTNSMVVGTTRWGFTISASLVSRGSGMATTPALGSMVQNGKFSAPIPALVSALNRVDLPTLGRPTMPQLNPMECLCWYGNCVGGLYRCLPAGASRREGCWYRSGFGFEAVQPVHGSSQFAVGGVREHPQGFVENRVEVFGFLFPQLAEYKTGHLAAIAGMADAQAQALEAVAAEVGNGIAE